MTRMSHNKIYLIYFFILISAFGWRFTYANSSLAVIKDIVINEKDSITEVVIELTNNVRPAIVFSVDDHCLFLNFSGVDIDQLLEQETFATRDIKLAYFNKIDDMKNYVRGQFFLQKECLASVSYEEKSIKLRLVKKDNFSKSDTIDRSLLLNPSDTTNAPVIIRMSGAPLLPVITELARSAGITLGYTYDCPIFFSANFQALSPMDAIKQIAKMCKLNLFRNTQGWLLSHVKK